MDFSRKSSANSKKEIRIRYGFVHDNRDNINFMTSKELVIEAVKSLPEDAAIEDAMERLFVLTKIERGIEEANAGQTIPHEEVKGRLAKWLK